MTQPTPYVREFDFTDFNAGSPLLPPPGTALDAEFNGIDTTLVGVLRNLALIQRDDGALANESVGLDQLSPQARALLSAGAFKVRSDGYVAGSSYQPGDIFVVGGTVYLAVAPFVAIGGTAATELAAGWIATLFAAAGSLLPRRISYGPRIIPRSYREALELLVDIPTEIVGFAAYAGTNGGAAYGNYYVNNPSLDTGTPNSFGWAYDQVLNAGGGNVVFDTMGFFPIELTDRLLWKQLQNATFYAPGRNVTFWADRLNGAFFLQANNVILKNIGVRPKPGPINGTAIGFDSSTARTLVQVDSTLSDKLAFLNCDIRHPSWHCLDVTRKTPANGSQPCRFSVQNSIFRDAIQGHLLGTDNVLFAPSDYTNDASVREIFGTFHQTIWDCNLQRNPKIMGNAYIDVAECLTILRPYRVEYVDRPDLGKTYPEVHTDAWGAGVMDGGWLRYRGSLVMSAHELADNVKATELIVGFSGNTGRISVEDSVAENGITFDQRDGNLIDPLPYDLPHTPVPAVGPDREAWVANLRALAGSKIDAAPEGLFVPLIGSDEHPNAETIVLDDRTDRSKLLQRVDSMLEYAIPTASAGSSGVLATPRGNTRYVGKAAGKSTGAAIGPKFVDITGLTSGYFSILTLPAAPATVKHIVASDDSISDGLHLEIFGSSSSVITITTATSVVTTAVNAATGVITAPAHGETNSGFQVEFTGAGIPAPLVANVIYYGIYVDANNFKVAAVYDDAVAGVPIALTTAGTAGFTATFGSFNLPGGTDIVLDSSAKVGVFILNTSNNRFNVSSKPVVVSKADVGLGNVDNTSDVNKPVSTAQATALALKANAASIPALASGSYTPALTNPVNCTGAAVVGAKYSRNGNIVTVSASLNLTLTAASTNTEISIALPVASPNLAAGDLSGVCANTTTTASAQVRGEVLEDTVNHVALCRFTSGTTVSGISLRVIFQYEVKP